MTRSLTTLAVLLACILAGCANAPSPAATSIGISGASNAMARIGVRSDVIAQQAKTTTPQPNRETILLQSAGIKTDAVEGQSQLDKATADEKLMDGHEREQDAKIENLTYENGRFFSKTQREWAGWIFGIWAAFGVASVILPLVWPVGGLAVSKFIARLLPFANIFSFVRDQAFASAVLP